MKYPLITAVMVTLGRLDRVRTSYSHFKRQTYPNKKLLIVTDGREDEHNALKSLVRRDQELIVLHVGEKRTLGELRNLSIEYAPSDLSIQWDDDDWYGPSRIMEQYEGLGTGKAVLLKEQLHFFADTSEVGWTADRSGIEGTLLLDRSCGLKYPAERRGEDSVLKKALRSRGLVNIVKGGVCYCRTYHGSNTWDRDHHVKRIKRLGKKKSEIDMAAMREAAKLYGWGKEWKPMFGSSSTDIVQLSLAPK